MNLNTFRHRAPLDAVPNRAACLKLVEEIRNHSEQGRQHRVDLRRICAHLGAEVRVAELGSARSGHEAMLVPLPRNRFGISVDPTPPRGWDRVPQPQRASLRRHRLRFRVAHELAHTFFYIRRERATPQRHLFDSDEQEDFCDSFSRSLLVSHGSAAAIGPSPRALLRLQRESDVSLEVAARAVAAARPELLISIWFENPKGGWELQWSTKRRGAAERQGALRRSKRRKSTELWLPERRQLVEVDQS